ncbi:MAG: HAD-IIB family hydrolase [Candidatus Paceibacterota bacterium]
MQCPKVAVFDVDDTLAESFQAPKPEMLLRLARLLECIPVAIISGAGFSRINDGFLVPLEKTPHIRRLIVLPNSSAQAYTWADGWNEEYNLSLSADEKRQIKIAFAQASEDLPLIHDTKQYGERIADREAQIAFTVVGLDAPQDIKMGWDPGAAKRRIIRDYLLKKLPEFDIRTGGASTIDVTHRGINKSYGVRWLSEKLKISPGDMLYVGDALYEGGNDAVVISTGIQTRSVTGPAETAIVIDELLSVCRA